MTAMSLESQKVVDELDAIDGFCEVVDPTYARQIRACVSRIRTALASAPVAPGDAELLAKLEASEDDARAVLHHFDSDRPISQAARRVARDWLARLARSTPSAGER